MARGRSILRPGTYGKVQVRQIGGTWRAQTRARLHGSDTSRAISRCDRESPEDAEDRLREYLHGIGLRDARNGAVSVRENVTEAEGQHDGEHVQAGDLDPLAALAYADAGELRQYATAMLALAEARDAHNAALNDYMRTVSA